MLRMADNSDGDSDNQGDFGDDGDLMDKIRQQELKLTVGQLYDILHQSSCLYYSIQGLCYASVQNMH
jgi:hypothetical protein